jgi:hypothetical protein
MRSMRPLTATAIMLVIGLLASTTGLLAIAGTAFGCEGAAAEIQTEDVTTHEKNAKFDPTEGRDEEWEVIFDWKKEETVKDSFLEVRDGKVWEELHRCANGTYKAGESCYVSALIDCPKRGEFVEAVEYVEIGTEIFADHFYTGECI